VEGLGAKRSHGVFEEARGAYETSVFIELGKRLPGCNIVRLG